MRTTHPYAASVAAAGALVAAFILNSDARLGVATPCANLTSLKLQDGTITSATEKTGPFMTAVATNTDPTFSVPGPFPFCLAEATLTPTSDSQIHIEVWLPSPARWNQKFVGIGNGGLIGGIRHASMVRPLSAGYAVANSDLGHAGSSPDFAQGHPEKLLDYAYRGDHVTAQAAKAIVDGYYGTAPRLSYFQGCSNGGHQALMEAQRYPDDYDAIVAGAPWNQWTHQNVEFIWRAIHMEHFNRDKLAMITKAVVAQCGTRNGGLATDEYLNDPRDCQFKPKSLQCPGADAAGCLTAKEVDAVEKVYAGPSHAKTGQRLYPGFERGSEAGWSGSGASNILRAMVFQSQPNWDFHTFNFASDVTKVDDALGAIINSNSTDLGAFQARGGKLIMFHGWADTTLEPRNTVNYYNNLVAVTGDAELQPRQRLEQTQQTVRLFMAPGMGHCRGGLGPNDIGQTGTADAHVGPTAPPIDADHDVLAALDRWVENSVAPDTIVASHYDGAVLTRTRPLCAYPNVAKYKGTGDKNSAGSFTCAADWSGFERDFAQELHNILSAVKHGDLRGLPN